MSDVASTSSLRLLPVVSPLLRLIWARVKCLAATRRSALRTAFLAAVAVVVAAVLRGKRRLQGAKTEWLLKRIVGAFLGLTVPVPVPRVVEGAGCVRNVAAEVRAFGCQKPLLVTDEALVKHGLVQRCTEALTAAGLEHELFAAVVPNPPSELVEQGHERYVNGGCDCLIAFGGGSPMDTAKVIGAKVANPKPSILSYEGFFNVNRLGLRPLPPLLAVPTTAGTGSETTVCAVITETRLKKKVVIADLGLVPKLAVLDPEVVEKLPKSITASTGMDALTHAVEPAWLPLRLRLAYLGDWSTKFTRECSRSAVRNVFGNLVEAYKNGSDLAARRAMLRAGFEGGLAFTRASIGYCHAIAHQLGGLFHTAHGDANAMLLPLVLERYLDAEAEECLRSPGHPEPCAERLRDLSVVAGVADAAAATNDARAAARLFVSRIYEMIQEMSMATVVPDMKATDVTEVAQRALREAHGESFQVLSRPWMRFMDLGYPVPRYFTQEDCEEIVARLLPTAERDRWCGKAEAKAEADSWAHNASRTGGA